MSAPSNHSHALKVLALVASLCVFSTGGLGQNETAQKPEQGTTPAIEPVSPEVLRQIEEGDILPDMPEPGTEGANSPPGSVAPAMRAAGPDYVLGPEDVLDIEVFNVPELKRTVRVSNDGMIGLTLIGRVKASGLTVDELRQQLEAEYAKTYLQDPQISVFVSDYHGQSVSVIGAVERPGIYQLTAPRNLIEILSMAGGLAKRSTAPAGRTLIVTRKGGFPDVPASEGISLLGNDKLEIDINKLLYSQETGLNIPIKSADTISVTKADLVYVVGDVRKPTGIVMEDREDITVLQAVAVAEGLNRTAARNKARIFRKTPDGGKIEIPVKLGDILKGKAPDLTLAANDILFIPDSRGKIMAERAFETTIATISGLIIWRSR